MLCSRLTVEFSPPWWVGTLERWEDDRYEVGRVVFGAEPTEPEVLLWVLHRLTRLRTTPAIRSFHSGVPESPAPSSSRPANSFRASASEKEAVRSSCAPSFSIQIRYSIFPSGPRTGEKVSPRTQNPRKEAKSTIFSMTSR